jgi:uncharacterized membrane protein
MSYLLALLYVAYPILVFLSFRAGENALAGPLCAVIAGLKLRQGLLRRGLGSWAATAVSLALAAGIVAASARFSVAPLFLPAVTSFFLLAVFAVSLAFPPNIIERIARAQEPNLHQEGAQYCRRVCFVWIAFLAANGTIALDSTFRSVQWWSLYNGLISYLLIGALFCAEYLCRLRIKRRFASSALKAPATAAAIAALMALCSPGAVAEPSPESAPPSLEAALKPPGPFRASFTEQRFISVLSAPLEASGEVICLPARGLIVRLSAPIQRDTLITKEKIEQRDGNGASLSVSGSSHVSEALLSLLSADAPAVSEEFTITVTGSNTAWRVTLYPKDSLVAQVVSRITVQGSDHPLVIEVLHASGDRIVTTYAPPVLLQPGEVSATEEILDVRS